MYLNIMYFIDYKGNIRIIPKQCLMNDKLLFEYLQREKYGIK